MSSFSHDSLLIAGAIFVSIYLVASLIYFLFRRQMQMQQELMKAEHARLDEYRAHLERQLMELNHRFAYSEDRWRELNHLVVAGQKTGKDFERRVGEVPYTRFLDTHGISPRDAKVRDDLIFVLTPFHDDLRDEFEAVSQVGQELGFQVLRGDERAAHGDIFSQLLRYLVQARVVVANITGRNPNVFYELGIAHALDKSVVLLAEKKGDVPFDVQSKLIVFYESNAELKANLSRTLARTVISRDA